MSSIRPAQVAGTFYSANPVELRNIVDSYLPPGSGPDLHPKALIAPHAGYPYSGPIAGIAYASIKDQAKSIRRVVLLGPSHRVAFRGMALPQAEAFRTPLGDVALDQEACVAMQADPNVRVFDRAHRLEHSLEVQLPFLQRLLGDFQLVPLSVGEIEPEDCANTMERFASDPATLIVVSSDLSHYHDYEEARLRDKRTSQAIVALDHRGIGREDACGRNPIRGLLLCAKRFGSKVRTLDLRNSGDTAGSRDRVVGYGAYAFEF